MIRIFKYKLDFTEEQIVKMPKGSQVLSVQQQGPDIVMWAIVDTDATAQEYPVYIVGTGWEYPVSHPVYISTIQQGPLVWHFFIDYFRAP